MRDEERPQIVVTNPSTDMSQEELDEEIKQHREEEDREFYLKPALRPTPNCLKPSGKKIEEGRIVFRKPEKRQGQADEGGGDDPKRKKAGGQQAETRVKSDKKMLSFADEDE